MPNILHRIVMQIGRVYKSLFCITFKIKNKLWFFSAILTDLYFITTKICEIKNSNSLSFTKIPIVQVLTKFLNLCYLSTGQKLLPH